jgi:hypothetical protein
MNEQDQKRFGDHQTTAPTMISRCAAAFLSFELSCFGFRICPADGPACRQGKGSPGTRQGPAGPAPAHDLAPGGGAGPQRPAGLNEDFHLGHRLLGTVEGERGLIKTTEVPTNVGEKRRDAIQFREECTQ